MTSSKIDLTTALAILQQAEYDLDEFLRWWQRRQSDSSQIEKIEPDRFTTKLKLVKLISSLLFFLPLPTRFKISLGLISPPQRLVVAAYLALSRAYLQWLRRRGLVVVAIAGSFGKTSTKHWLGHLLQGQLEVLMTAKSINTPLGIARTILTSLKSSHQLFIVELGEYYRGDIKELSDWLEPDYGVITPIGHQHLHRMKSIATIGETIGELLDHFEARGLSDQVVSAVANESFFSERVGYFGAKQTATWVLSQAKVSRQGTSGQITHRPSGKVFEVFCPLYGSHQLENSLAGFWLGEKLGLSLEKLSQRAATMPAIPQRHQPHFLNGDVLMLDNSYNTNPEVMKKSLELLNKIEASQRLVVTLGYVELGQQAASQHLALGKMLAQQADLVALIESEWTEQILKGWRAVGGKNERIFTAKTPEKCLELLTPFFKPGTLILFEGGYRQVLV